MGFLKRFFGKPDRASIPVPVIERMRRELREVVRRYAEVDHRSEMRIAKRSFFQRLFDWFTGK